MVKVFFFLVARLVGWRKMREQYLLLGCCASFFSLNSSSRSLCSKQGEGHGSFRNQFIMAEMIFFSYLFFPFFSFGLGESDSKDRYFAFRRFAMGDLQRGEDKKKG